MTVAIPTIEQWDLITTRDRLEELEPLDDEHIMELIEEESASSDCWKRALNSSECPAAVLNTHVESVTGSAVCDDAEHKHYELREGYWEHRREAKDSHRTYWSSNENSLDRSQRKKRVRWTGLCL